MGNISSYEKEDIPKSAETNEVTEVTEVVDIPEKKIVEYVDMDNFTKQQLLNHIKTIITKQLEINDNNELFKKINLESNTLIAMCIELYEKAAAILPENIDDPETRKTSKKKYFVKPQFGPEKVAENINANIITVPEITIALYNPGTFTVGFNNDTITISEFNSCFRDTNYKKDFMGISKKLLFCMTDLQKQRFINVFMKMYTTGVITSGIGKASYIYKESKQGPKDNVDSFRR